LSREEVVLLFDIIKKLKGSNLSIVYISHHLPEIFEVADRVTVLRDGKRIATENIEDVTTEKLIEMMVGRKMESMYAEREKRPGKERFRAENLSRYGFFHDISFEVKAGRNTGYRGAFRSRQNRTSQGSDRKLILLTGGKGVSQRRRKFLLKLWGDAIKGWDGYLTEDERSQGTFRFGFPGQGRNILGQL